MYLVNRRVHTLPLATNFRIVALLATFSTVKLIGHNINTLFFAAIGSGTALGSTNSRVLVTCHRFPGLICKQATSSREMWLVMTSGKGSSWVMLFFTMLNCNSSPVGVAKRILAIAMSTSTMNTFFSDLMAIIMYANLCKRAWERELCLLKEEVRMYKCIYRSYKGKMWIFFRSGCLYRWLCLVHVIIISRKLGSKLILFHISDRKVEICVRSMHKCIHETSCIETFGS